MARRLLAIFGLLLVMLAGACSTGSGHPAGKDAGAAGGNPVNSGTGGSGGVDAGIAPSACGTFKPGPSNTYETATLNGRAAVLANSDTASKHTTIELYAANADSPFCARGGIVPPASGDYGWAILQLDVNSVLQSSAGNEDAGINAGTSISSRNSMTPRSDGLLVNVNKKVESSLWMCLLGADFDQWCVKTWTNPTLLRWTDFVEEFPPYANYAMQPLINIQFTIPSDVAAFDFCVDSVVEAATWCACPGGNCSCPSGTNACNGACVDDTSVNPLNCGKCGQVCANTSACQEGECNDSLYGELDTPGVVALDGSSLYFTEWRAGNVMQVDLSGGAPEAIATGQKGPWAMAAQGGSVYWANGGTSALGYADASIMKWVGGVTTPLVDNALASVVNDVSALAADSKFLYWSNAGTLAKKYADGSIMKVDLASHAVTPLVTTGLTRPMAIAIDANAIYWAEQGTADWGSFNSDGRVMRLAFNETTPQPLATGQLAPMAIAVDANNVYYAGSDSVFKISLADMKSTTTLATGQSQPFMLAVDATNVYWTDSLSGSLVSVPIAGGSKPITLAKAQTYALGLALTNTDVYWVTQTDVGTGGILKTPK